VNDLHLSHYQNHFSGFDVAGWLVALAWAATNAVNFSADQRQIGELRQEPTPK
jgi:hypothetical protein